MKNNNKKGDNNSYFYASHAQSKNAMHFDNNGYKNKTAAMTEMEANKKE